MIHATFDTISVLVHTLTGHVCAWMTFAIVHKLKTGIDTHWE